MIEKAETKLPARIYEKFVPEPNSGCWLWTASTNAGYGEAWWSKRNIKAHRLVYEMLVGPIPGELQLDHLCRVRCCVNPEHLEIVTNLENARRGMRATQTHCKRGHLFDDENTYIESPGRRKCRECRRQAVVSYRRRRRSGILAVPNSTKTHCKRGHLFNDENTYYYPDGSRSCRKCRAIASKKQRAKRDKR